MAFLPSEQTLVKYTHLTTVEIWISLFVPKLDSFWYPKYFKHYPLWTVHIFKTSLFDWEMDILISVLFQKGWGYGCGKWKSQWIWTDNNGSSCFFWLRFLQWFLLQHQYTRTFHLYEGQIHHSLVGLPIHCRSFSLASFWRSLSAVHSSLGYCAILGITRRFWFMVIYTFGVITSLLQNMHMCTSLVQGKSTLLSLGYGSPAIITKGKFSYGCYSRTSLALLSS